MPNLAVASSAFPFSSLPGMHSSHWGRWSMFPPGRRDFSVVITEYHLDTLTKSLDLNIIVLNVIQIPIWKMSCPSNAMVSLPGSYRKSSLIPINLTEFTKRCGDRLFLNSDLKQPPLEITDCSYGHGIIWLVTAKFIWCWRTYSVR